MANDYTSTHPASRFTQSLIVQKLATRARTTLRNRDLIVDTGETVTTRTLQGDHEILRALAETFDLRFPAGTRFPAREDVF
ncbi:MAG: arylamine N-acetyltransferase [Acidobacteria bacterium]|nr:arylamine N-acetyltransferase [Acidobacteriota bacterium]